MDKIPAMFCENAPESTPRKSMPSRRKQNLFTLLRLCLPVLSLCLFLCSQTNPGSDNSTVVLKSKVQIVLLDVVVLDHNGQPIKDLSSGSFDVLENGKQQAIASFEEHRGDPPSTTVLQRAALPPHFYTNAPTSEPPGAINVLLLDRLNTDTSDQANVQRELIKYLKSLEPGPHLAIFALGEKLRMLEGFTDDPNVLLSILNNKKSGSGPHVPMGTTVAESNSEQQLVNGMAEPISAPGSPGGTVSAVPPGMVEDLQNFLAEVRGTERVSTTSLTLQALQDLSRYLNGFHGRKNIIWFSGSFPQILFPSGGERTRVDMSGTGLDREMRQTINMLAAAQVAVYPVAAQGVETQALFQAQSLAPAGQPGQSLRERMSTGQNQVLQDEQVARYTNQKAADDIASNTGGQAFYNTNGLTDALADIVHKGAYYYRISYSPTDKKMIGRYRRIEVRVKKGPYANPATVSYRHGYYEEDEAKTTADKTAAVPDFLQPLMKPGLPDATELIYNLRLLRTEKPVSGSPQMGDNAHLEKAAARIKADFVVPIDSLVFDTTPDGVRHGKVELALVAYDRAGTPLNWLFRLLNTTIKPELYTTLKTNGAQFHEEIDVPDGENYLRAGVYDLMSDKSGTLQLALSRVTALENVAANTTNAGGSTELLASARGSLPPATGSAPPPGSGGPAFKLMPNSDLSLSAWRALGSGPTADQMKQLLPADVPAYCLTLAGSGDHSPALENVCEFAFSMVKKLPDVICNRETKRYRNGRRHAEKLLDDVAQGKAPDKNYFDVVSSKVAYLNGREYYSDVRINGAPVDAEAPWRGGAWSIGEFSSILVSIFLPSSKPELHFEKEEILHSVPVLVFDYHISAENNKSYFLSSSDRLWFPGYNGKLWLDKANFRLLRLQRETPDMPSYPINRVRTEIDYSSVGLGDGTNLVLPNASTALVCSANYCGVNIMAFADWHKFRATTNIKF